MFKTIEDALNSCYINRQREIRGLILSVLTNENIVFIGPAGTAKTAIGDDFCKMLGLNWFPHLMTRFTVPEELFGPLSLTMLKQDKYTRVKTGSMLEADLAALDEVFKANSSILNSLLNAMNERVYRENGITTPIPLMTLIGMSNELPESAELNAFFDRFMLRYKISYLDMEQKVDLMRSRLSYKPTLPTFSRDKALKNIKKAMSEIAKIEFSDANIDMYIAICFDLKQNHGIEVSDRRDVKMINIFKANAWMDGRTSVTNDDFSVLENTLWRAPEEIPVIASSIIKVASPLRLELQGLLDASYETYSRMLSPALKGLDAIKLQMELAAINSEMKAIAATATKKVEGRSEPYIKEYMDRITEFRKKCVKMVIDNVEV